jgi:pteridine reductase
MNISGKAAIVTGSSRRIGRAIAIELGRRGAKVGVHHRSAGSRTDAEETLRLVRQAGGDGQIFRAELMDLQQAQALLDAVLAAFGSLDILVNNASVFSSATADETTEALWDEQLGSNAKAPFFLSQRAARVMQQGKIVNLADVAGEAVWPGYLAYSVSKAALIAVSRGLAKTLAPHIQVNAIAPGPVLFPEYYDDDQKKAAIGRTLLKREGSPVDIVNAVMFLIENDYITGELIHVDGGRHVM